MVHILFFIKDRTHHGLINLPIVMQTSALDGAQVFKRGWNSSKLFNPHVVPEEHVPGSQSPSPIPHVLTSQYSSSYWPHFPLILLADGILLLLLMYNSEFKYSKDIELCKETLIQIIWSILLPSGLAAMVASVCLYTEDQPQKTELEATKSVGYIKKLCKRFGMFLSFGIIQLAKLFQAQ